MIYNSNIMPPARLYVLPLPFVCIVRDVQQNKPSYNSDALRAIAYDMPGGILSGNQRNNIFADGLNI